MMHNAPDAEKGVVLVEPADIVFQRSKNFFQNQARGRLCLAKEACRGLCSETKTTHTAITSHA